MGGRPVARVRRVQLLKRLIVLPALVAPVPAWAQVQDDQLWWQLNAVAPVAPKLRVTLEQIERFSDRQGGLYQTEVGAILGYRPNDHVEIGFGYRRVGGHNGARGADEDRVRQHVVVTYGRFVGRFRIDERFRDDRPGVGVRVRPLLRYNLPLARKGFALFYSHESILLANTTVWGQRAGFDRMRNIVGVTLPLGRRVSADVGYLNQYRVARAGSAALMEHALSIQTTVTMAQHAAPKVDD